MPGLEPEMRSTACADRFPMAKHRARIQITSRLPSRMNVAEPEILFARKGAAGVVTLNRPQALNAVTLGMVRALTKQLQEWRGDASITRVVVTAAGGRAFSAGGDI